MDNAKRFFYYNATDDVWQEEKCAQDDIDYRISQLRIRDRRFSYVYLPMIWRVELLADKVLEVVLLTKRVTIRADHITESTAKEWTIECDFANGVVRGWPISLVRNEERNWRNGYVCGGEITFPELLAARYVDIPAVVIDVAIEYLKDVAKDKFGFRPSYLGDAHGLMHMIAFCESPLDPNLYILKDVLGNEAYGRIKEQGQFDSYRELCRHLAIENPPPSLRKAYVMNPESVLVYVYLRQCGFRDINIIRRFFYREEIFGYKLLSMRYDSITGLIRLKGPGEYESVNFQRYIRWLLRHRSEKAIAARVHRWCNDSFSRAAADILRMFAEARLDENEGIIDPAVRRRLLNEGLTQDVHDVLVEEIFIARPAIVNRYPFEGELHQAFKYVNTVYEYKDRELALEAKLGDYTFHLPKETDELRKWGMIFHNCVASYDSNVIDKTSLILAMKEKKKFIACIEVRQGRIIQALGYCNERLAVKYRRIIGEWAKDKKIYYGNCPAS